MDKIIVYRIIRKTTLKFLYVGCVSKEKLEEELRDFFKRKLILPEDVTISYNEYDSYVSAEAVQEVLIVLKKPIYNKQIKIGWKTYDYVNNDEYYYLYDANHNIESIVFRFNDIEMIVHFPGKYTQLMDWMNYIYPFFENVRKPGITEYEVPMVMYPFPKSINITKIKHYSSSLLVCTWYDLDKFMRLYFEGIVTLKVLLDYFNKKETVDYRVYEMMFDEYEIPANNLDIVKQLVEN